MAPHGHAYRKSDRHSLPACLREIFDASFWKNAHQQFEAFEQNRTRWTLPACMYMGLAMALEPEGSETERFERTRELLACLFPKRRRCGKTLSGYHQALADLPLEFFDVMRAGMQRAVQRHGLNLVRVGRWEAYGIDGSKEELPRTQAHEDHYGIVTKNPGSAERLVVTAVSLRRCVLWDWASDSALGSERALALNIIRRLPPGSLSVLDAGFIGYEWGMALKASGRNFLARVGGNATFWVESLPNAEWHEDQVWLWPEAKKYGPPLVLRLIKIELPCRNKRGKPQTMWLVTNVLDAELLTREEAAKLYSKRWPASECTFRTWKHTLNAEKLSSRTPIMAEPESEFFLCALMLLQVSICIARRKHRRDRRRISVAKAKRVWLRATRDLAKARRRNKFREELSECVGDRYRRRKPKVRRQWPKRKEPRAIKSPNFRKLGKRRKALGNLRLGEQKRATA